MLLKYKILQFLFKKLWHENLINVRRIINRSLILKVLLYAFLLLLLYSKTIFKGVVCLKEAVLKHNLKVNFSFVAVKISKHLYPIETTSHIQGKQFALKTQAIFVGYHWIFLLSLSKFSKKTFQAPLGCFQFDVILKWCKRNSQQEKT